MIQTYEPASPGMLICIKGGRYVLYTDHLAEIVKKDEEIAAVKELLEDHRQQYADKCSHFIASENARVQSEALLEAIEYMIEGEQGTNEPSDFMMSFGIVRDVWDHFQNYEYELVKKDKEIAELKALLAGWLKFSEDVMPSCAAGMDWLRTLRNRTENVMEGEGI